MKKILIFIGMILIFSSFAYASSGYFDNLQFYWTFDRQNMSINATGNWSIRDLKGNTNATITEPITQNMTGIHNDSFYFPNGTELLTTSPSYGLPNTNFTITVWLKPVYNDIFFGADCIGGYSVLEVGDRSTIGSNDKFCFYAYDTAVSNTCGVCTTTSANYDNSTWYFVVFVHDNANKKNLAYLNGINEANTTCGTGVHSATGYVFGGNCGGASIYTYKGFMDELAIYNYTLTPTNITNLYNSGTGLFPPDYGKANVTPSTNYTLFFPGTLIDNNLYQNEFIYSGNTYTNFNLSYVTAGSKTVYINFSNQGDLAREGYFNFTIKAFDLDTGNSFNYTENFVNSSYINSSSLKNTTAPMSVLDDFENNATASRYTLESITGFTTGEPNNYVPLDSTNEQSSIIFNIPIDNITRFNFTSEYCNAHTCGYSCSGDTGYNIIATDLTNSVTLFSSSGGYGLPSSPSCTYFLYNFTGEKSGNTWTIYQNGVSVGSGSIISLNSPKYLKLVSSASGEFGSIGTSNWHIFDLKTSGIRLKRLNGTYERNVSFGTFESSTLFTAPNNLIRAYADVTGIAPENTDIDYYVSNDNGSSYESIVNHNFHTFTTTGKSLKFKAVLNSTDNYTTPFISDYNIKILPASPIELIIDVGSDNSVDMRVNGTLNSTTTPVNFTGNDSCVRNYLTNHSGLIPISFVLGSGGIVELSNLNLTRNINPISLNITPIQNLNTISIRPTMTTGKIRVDDLKFDFKGSKNFTVYAHNSDYSSSINRTIFVKYSPFNISFPSEVTYWGIYPSKRNQSNIQPYGQNSTRGIFKIDNLGYGGNIDIYARYNNTNNLSCVTNMNFRGQNFSKSSLNNLTTLNITNLTANLQPIVYNLSASTFGNVWTYTMINCSAYSKAFIIPYFCFNSLCSNCVITQDFQDNCDVIE